MKSDPLSLRTWGDVRRHVLSCLSAFPSPVLEADSLIMGLMGCERAWLHGHLDETMTRADCELILSGLTRRLRHEPLQYITGRCDFYGHNFLVAPGCLVPRPETEFLVEAALSHFSGGNFLDWGTGTGCIGLTLLAHRPDSRAILAEKNPRSLVCAWNNAKEMSLLSRLTLWHSREPWDIPGGSLDLIVSNPPYVPSDAVPQLMAEVSQWEPHLALDGGSDGLAPYPALFELARRRLKRGGFLCVEFGGDAQSVALRTMAGSGFVETQMIRDYAGIPRILVWQSCEV